MKEILVTCAAFLRGFVPSKCILLFLFAVGCGDAIATQRSWTNSLGGSWFDASNWSPNGVPGASDTTFITADGTLGLPAVSVVRGGAPPQVTVTLRTRPQLRLGQRATLSLDGVSAEALPRAVASDPLVFNFPNSTPVGNRWVRLRVDGVDSPLVQRSGPAPVFDPTQQLAVPA